MIKKTSNWKEVFKNAANGCFWAFRTQKNFKTHFFLSFMVLILAWWLRISFEKFLILIFAVTFGLVIEMANTAFEKTVDLITEEYNPKAKIAKDVAAGAMLLTAIGLALIGLLALFPPLWEKMF